MSATGEKDDRKGGIGETVKVVLQALLLALVVRTFLYQPFNIPSGSMKSTLLIGDYLFVSKFSYGYGRYSFPFGLAPFSGRIWAGEPKRGDVIVFRHPHEDEDLIKRLIGLPGDHVQMRGGVLHINGEAVKRERVEDFVEPSHFGRDVRARRYRETLPNGVTYLTLDLSDNGPLDDTPEYVVPEGRYFMMGDNRDNSTDSRVLDQVGYVPFDNLLGRAEIIFFSIADAAPWQIWRWPGSVRWSHIFDRL